MALIRHPASACPPVEMCQAIVAQTGPVSLRVEYSLSGGVSALDIPALAPPARQDNLWQTTCFELFLALEGSAYAEFNFSPSTCWAAYLFDAYRSGMRPAQGIRPVIAVERSGNRLDVAVELDLAPLVPDLNRALGLSAVIEEQDGGKSWWALTHPSEKPDFHLRDCFALQLRAASGS